MSKKKNTPGHGIVYSTNPDFSLDPEPEEEAATLAPAEQLLKVTLDKKQRAGKVVTLITGFVGKEEDREKLGKELKTKCGAGGSVKDGEILIQGDYKEKITKWLMDWGYKRTK